MSDIVVWGRLEGIGIEDVRFQSDGGWHLTLKIELYGVKMDELQGIEDVNDLLMRSVKVKVEHRYEYD